MQFQFHQRRKLMTESGASVFSTGGKKSEYYYPLNTVWKL